MGLFSSSAANRFGLSQNFEITHTPVEATMGRPRFYLGSYPDLGRAMRAPTMNFADSFEFLRDFEPTNRTNVRLLLDGERRKRHKVPSALFTLSPKVTDEV